MTDYFLYYQYNTLSLRQIFISTNHRIYTRRKYFYSQRYSDAHCQGNDHVFMLDIRNTNSPTWSGISFLS